ncbi:MAG: Transcriptional regulator, MarR family [Cytophagales bacterium]|jgi:DNA-binding MarR family transcriptional regulator|nr:MarR family transcriptional regulator [Bacteroidota bacterium]MBS1979993.1 MarR family transcriptional regulator [Bacteroidota bacterium]WHZ07260.1 MAG: Transcriptional regulator, MarR family [Cytophagales bacterium]
MKREETIDHHIRTAWHGISRFYNQQASRFGGTMSIGFALLTIHGDEGTPATKIAPQMGLEPRSLTRLLKSMEDNKLIVRKADKNDKRSVRVFLTREGKKRRENAKEIVIRFNESVREEISQQKLNVFFEVIQHIQLLSKKTDSNNK